MKATELRVGDVVDGNTVLDIHKDVNGVGSVAVIFGQVVSSWSGIWFKKGASVIGRTVIRDGKQIWPEVEE